MKKQRKTTKIPSACWAGLGPDGAGRARLSLWAHWARHGWQGLTGWAGLGWLSWMAMAGLDGDFRCFSLFFFWAFRCFFIGFSLFSLFSLFFWDFGVSQPSPSSPATLLSNKLNIVPFLRNATYNRFSVWKCFFYFSVSGAIKILFFRLRGRKKYYFFRGPGLYKISVGPKIGAQGKIWICNNAKKLQWRPKLLNQKISKKTPDKSVTMCMYFLSAQAWPPSTN